VPLVRADEFAAVVVLELRGDRSAWQTHLLRD
jgi:hypothetical protein